MSPRIDGLRLGNDTAGKNGLQIGGTKRDAGKRAENVFRLCAAQHARVARQQQNGVFTTRREDERRRAERRETLEPHGRGTREAGDDAAAELLAAGATRERNLRRQRPHAGARAPTVACESS